MFDSDVDRDLLDPTVTGGHLPYVSGGPIRVDLTGADSRGHCDALVESDLIIRQADAARVDVVASALSSAAFLDDGHKDPAAWIRATLDVSKATSLQLVRRARLAHDHPGFLDALRVGAIHIDHYDVIARAHQNPRARHLLGDFVDEFVHCAHTLPFTDFQHVIDLWVRLADDDGPVPVDPRDTQQFRVRNKRDGSCEIQGVFAPAAAAVIGEIYNRFLDAENDVDHAAARDAGTPGETPRSLAERRVDAFMAMITQAVATPPGEPATPLVRITVDWDTAQDLLGQTDGEPDPGSWRDRRCRTFEGQPVDPSTVVDAMIIGNVQVMILDALRNPFAMGAPGSLFTAKQRDALLSLHTHCAVDGCLVAHRHLQADHVHPRSLGGATHPTNGVATCGRHNRWRHNHGYHLWRDPDGRWHTLRPDGSALRPEPPDAASPHAA